MVLVAFLWSAAGCSAGVALASFEEIGAIRLAICERKGAITVVCVARLWSTTQFFGHLTLATLEEIGTIGLAVCRGKGTVAVIQIATLWITTCPICRLARCWTRVILPTIKTHPPLRILVVASGTSCLVIGYKWGLSRYSIRDHRRVHRRIKNPWPTLISCLFQIILDSLGYLPRHH